LLFERLEQELADWAAAESCLVFQSGYSANVGTITVVAGRGDLVVGDEYNHASFRDGVRLSGAALRTYRHRDANHLNDLLRRSRIRSPRRTQRIIVITDGVFGTEGTIAPLPDICDVAERYGAMVIVDDAHATGVLGSNGRGSVDHFGLRGRVHVQIGSLSKGLGAIGGFVCTSSEVRQQLLASSRPIVYSTMLPPVAAAASSAALGTLEAEPDLVDRLWFNTRHLHKSLVAVGLDLGETQTPILPVRMATFEQSRQVADGLQARGVIVQAVSQRFEDPWHPRLRLIARADLAEDELDACVDALKVLDEELGSVVSRRT
jgi:glycine C-acetyltransferase